MDPPGSRQSPSTVELWARRRSEAQDWTRLLLLRTALPKALLCARKIEQKVLQMRNYSRGFDQICALLRNHPVS